MLACSSACGVMAQNSSGRYTGTSVRNKAATRDHRCPLHHIVEEIADGAKIAQQARIWLDWASSAELTYVNPVIGPHGTGKTPAIVKSYLHELKPHWKCVLGQKRCAYGSEESNNFAFLTCRPFKVPCSSELIIFYASG